MARKKRVVTRKKRMKPKGKRGQISVKRLGRTYKTGGFERIAQKAAKRYGSAERGRKVAGSVYWKMVKKRKSKR